MSGFAERVKLIAYKWWYSHSTKLVVQAHYMNSKVLVRPNEDVGLQILTGTFEKNDLIYLLSKLKEGDLFIDVGANIGLFSIVVAKANATVRVHALHRPGGRLLPTARPACPPARCCAEAVAQAAASPHISIDDFMKIELRAAKIVDAGHVEGAEKLVLDGARNIFVDHSMQPRLILMELFDQNFKQFKTSITEIVQLLGGYGYKPFFIEDGRKEEFMPLHHNFVYNVFFELGESA